MTAADAGAIKATIDFDANGLQRAVDRAMSQAGRTISTRIDQSMDRAEGRIKSGFRRTGLMLAGFLGLDAIAGRIVQAGTYITTLGAKVEGTLNTFQSVSQATGAQMEKVSAKAKALGDDISIPGASAADAAEAMTELAKGGLNVEQALAAAQGTLQLAAAAQIEGAAAAEIQASALNAFRLGADKAGMVADTLANSANASAAEIGDMAQALAQAGAIANAAGLSIQETATFLAQFANAGIKGSDAGTLLKTMLMRLQAPTGVAAKEMERLGLNVYDANGQMVGAEEITRRLIEATAGMTEADRAAALAKIFGADAIRGVNVLLDQGIEGHLKAAKAMEQEGSAARVAAARSKGLGGAIKGLVSMIESLAIEIYGNVAPAMDDWLRGVLDKLPGVMEDAATYTSALMHALEPAGRLVAQFVSAAKPGAILAFKAALATLLGTAEVLGGILEPLADLIERHEAVFQAVVGPLVAATLAYKMFKHAVSGLGQIRTEVMAGAARQAERYRDAMRGATTATSRLRVVGGGLVGAMGGPWGLAIGGAITAIGIFANKQADARARVDGLKESLNQQTGALTKNSREWAAKVLREEDALGAAETLGISLPTLTDAVLGEKDALRLVNAALRATERSSGDLEDTSRNLAGGLTATEEAYGKQRNAAETLRAALESVGATVRKGRHEFRLEAEAAKTSADAKRQHKAASEILSGTEAKLYGQTYATNRAFTAQKDAANAAKAAIRGLNQESLKGISAQIDFQQAADDLRKQIKSLNPQVRNSGKALNITTQAGRDTYRAFINLVNASSGVEGGMKRARQQIFNTIRPMVDSDKQAWRLTNQFFKLRDSANQVPNNVHVDVRARVGPAIDALEDLDRKLNWVARPRDARITITQVYANTPHQTLGGLQRAAGGAVFGPGTGTSDSIPARLSNGEHVWTAREVDAAGGHGNVTRLRRAVLDGAIAFAEGGGLAQRRTRPVPLAKVASAEVASLVENLNVEVGTKDDLPEALDETLFHLRRIKRGGRYAAE